MDKKIDDVVAVKLPNYRSNQVTENSCLTSFCQKYVKTPHFFKGLILVLILTPKHTIIDRYPIVILFHINSGLDLKGCVITKQA